MSNPACCYTCCTNTLRYCDQNICDGIVDFDILAQPDGTYTMITHFLSKQITITKDFLNGDRLVFPIDQLNENYTYTCQLFDPDGDKIIITRNSIDYDCFTFQTVMVESIAAPASP